MIWNGYWGSTLKSGGWMKTEGTYHTSIYTVWQAIRQEAEHAYEKGLPLEGARLTVDKEYVD